MERRVCAAHSRRLGRFRREEVKLSDSMFGGGVANATETKVATGGGGVVKLDLDDTMDF